MFYLYDHSSIEPFNDYIIKFSDTFGIKWYGFLIVLGAILAYLFGTLNLKKFNIKKDDLIDGFIIGLCVGVLGARLWYVLFNLDQFRNPLHIITKFMDGGLAIHGGIFAGTIFAYFFCKKKKINPFKIAELLFPGFLIGQTFGRWGNFFNQEAHGGLVPGYPNLDAQRAWFEKWHFPEFITNQMYINQPWDSAHPVAGYYHPTFLYESMWNLTGLVIIILLRKFWKKYWVGDAMFFYFVWYSVGRFFIEGMRTDSLYAGGLRTAQVTSIILIIVGVVGFTLRRIYRVYPHPYIGFNEENTNLTEEN